jgi:ribosomal protein S20
MPIIKSAQKQQRADVRKHEKNLKIKDFLKKAVKEFKKSPSFKRLQAAQSEIDKAVKKGVLKKNTAARRKAGLARTAKEAGVKVVVTAKKATVVVKPKATATAAKTKAAKKPSPASTAKTTTTKTATAKVKKPVAKSTAAKKPATKKA